MCKDTVASISEPVQHNSYGHSEGAWMRDARGHGNVIYLTNGHYGSNLQEFRDMDTFKAGTELFVRMLKERALNLFWTILRL